MKIIFEITDKSGRKIRLTEKQWSHIMKRHPSMKKYINEIQDTIKMPFKIMDYPNSKGYYYRNYKHLKLPNRFILIVVKYLNGDGFVITAYQTNKIK